MKKNDIIELEITDLTTTGNGIGRFDGMAVFVRGALPGEKVKAKVIALKKRYAVAITDEILVQSPQRVNAPCPVFGKCGGCTMQDLAYAAQLDFKHEHVKDCLARIGHLDDVEVMYPLPCTEQYRYRNKAAFALEEVDGKVHIGFYAMHSHRVVDVDDCLLQDETVKIIMSQVRVWITKSGATIYNEHTGEGLLRHILVRSNGAGEFMLVLVINGKQIPEEKKLLQLLSLALPQVKSIVLNVNEERGNTILGKENIILKGSGLLLTEIADMTFRIGPSSFLQVNTAQTGPLYWQLLRQLRLRPADRMLDLFCGVGTISLLAARRCAHVTGIENVPEAVENARFAALLNEVDNADFLAGDAGELLESACEKEKPDVVIVNPPRKGLTPELIGKIAHIGPRTVGYVSCDPATLARDAALFGECGYMAGGAQPVDLFPQTSHVETVMTFSRVGPRPEGENHV